MSLASPEKGENFPKTQMLFGDSSVQSFKHSGNRAVCVATTAAIQTFAAIANKLECVESIEFDEKEPKYCVFLDPKSEFTPRLISGIFWAIKGIATNAPGTIEVHDSRTGAPKPPKVSNKKIEPVEMLGNKRLHVK